MNSKITELLTKNIKKDSYNIKVGSTVIVTVKIKEGAKERNQKYEGVVIQLNGKGLNKTFTVRRVFQGVGVERVFFINSPKIEKVELVKHGKSRRAKLYYLRDRTGKATKLKEQLNITEGERILQKETIPEEGKLVEVSS